jgi:hypothetical protein
MEAAPDIVVKLWDNVSSQEEALKIVKEKFAWDSCVVGMMAIHPTLSFEEALVLVVHYEDPMYEKSKDYNQELLKCVPKMREFIRLEIKKTCALHKTCVFEEWFILAKYKYLKKN